MNKKHVYRVVCGITALTIYLSSIFSCVKSYSSYIEDKNNEIGRLREELTLSKKLHLNDNITWYNKYISLEHDTKDLQHTYSKVLNENKVLRSRIEKVKTFYENAREIPIYDYTEEEVYLLAQCVQAEAGGYEVADVAQKMITQVILNRVSSGHFPTTIEDVIYQKRNGIPQFSVAYNGMLEKQEVTPETMMNVLEVLMYGYEMPSNVLYFYADYVKGNWVNSLKVYKTVQGTVFAYSND